MRLFFPRLLVASLIGLAACTAPAHAATDTKTQTVQATISAAAALTLSSSTITFANANPGTTPSVAATEGAISATASARTSSSGTVSLTVLASGDLTSGSDTIDIGNVTWTSTGSGYQAGTLNKTTAQAVGSWTGSGVRTGSLNFAFLNQFAYTTGTYSATITYTLTAP